MAISYNKMKELFKQRGVTSYTFKKEKIAGQSTWKKIQEGGNIDMKTINSICKYLKCQPSDLLEYVEDIEQKTE